MTLLMALLYTETNSQLGQDISGSLPNITGSITCGENNSAFSTSGAFSKSGSGYYGGFTEVKNNPLVSFTASKSNSVYSASAGENVVRPTSIGVVMWKRVL